jgi:hypothetical protein
LGCEKRIAVCVNGGNGGADRDFGVVYWRGKFLALSFAVLWTIFLDSFFMDIHNIGFSSSKYFVVTNENFV